MKKKKNKKRKGKEKIRQQQTKKLENNWPLATNVSIIWYLSLYIYIFLPVIILLYRINIYWDIVIETIACWPLYICTCIRKSIYYAFRTLHYINRSGMDTMDVRKALFLTFQWSKLNVMNGTVLSKEIVVIFFYEDLWSVLHATEV